MAVSALKVQTVILKRYSWDHVSQVLDQMVPLNTSRSHMRSHTVPPQTITWPPT